MNQGTILIVDDNKGVLSSLELLFEGHFGRILTASSPNQITSILPSTPVDVVVLDMNFSAGINNGNEGLYWLKKIQTLCPSLPVVLLTAYGDVELAVQALKNGAADFLLKPWDNNVLLAKIKEATQGNLPKKKSKKQEPFEMLIGHSPAMLQLMHIARKVAQTDANILITGENGTGKELLAKQIHHLSPRNAHPLATVDMGALSESLFESELFGHERGAFTSAHESRAGKFEAANGSSLFMDEIGNLPLPLQAKLLTALQSRTVTRLGSNKAIPIDIRLISATNGDIPAMVARGEFREDLFYRINTIHLEIPPLRDRGDDILLFIDIFLRKFAAKYQRQAIQMTESTIDKLRGYHWPGNIRELEHAIEKAVILCEGNTIRQKDILVKQGVQPPKQELIVQQIEQVERQAIEVAILKNHGNITAAAQQLGISRQTLYNKLKRFR